MRQRDGRILVVALALLLAVPTLVGCAGPADGPRDRLGALPFPGFFTLYSVADPARLGEHRYERTPRIFRPDETERGIIYTARAGFLDIAHVRITIDEVRFCAGRVRVALEQRRD